nr:hypothetical protein [Tanacetum cinerariifolium]
MPPKKAAMSDVAIKELIAQCMADELVEYEANRNSNPANTNGDDRHDSGIGSGSVVHTTQECTYKDFFNHQPLNFKDVVSYAQRFQELALMYGRMLPEESGE